MYGKKKVFLQLLIENINFVFIYEAVFFSHALQYFFLYSSNLWFLFSGRVLYSCWQHSHLFFLFQEDKEHRHTFCVPFFEAFLWF